MTALRLLSRTKLYWGLAAIFLIGVLSSPVSSKGNNIFLSYGNLLDVLRQVSTTGLIATGMTAVILTAGIDLSVGSIMALCSVVCAMLLTVPGWTPAATMGIPALALTVFVVLAAVTRFGFRSAASAGVVAGWRSVAALGPLRGVALPMAAGLAGVGVALWFLLPQVATKFGVVGVLLVAPAVGLMVGAINGIIIVGGRLQPFIVTESGDWKQDQAYDIMATALRSNEDIDLVYGHNDPMAYGAYLAAKDVGREGDIKFIGIDALPNEGVMWVHNGELAATFLYATPGAEGLRQALKFLNGETVEKAAVLDTMTITKENAEEILKANGLM